MAAANPQPDNYIALPCNDAIGHSSLPSTSTVPVGTVIGSVIGGLAILASAVALFWWVRRRKQRKQLPERGMNSYRAQVPEATQWPGQVSEMYSESPQILYSPKSNHPRQDDGSLSSASEHSGRFGSPHNDPEYAARWPPHTLKSPTSGRYEVPG